VTILKFLLYISKDEQKRRLEARRADPKKQWKFSLADIKERQYWDDYIDAYEDMLTRCHTEYAPWHIVPGNHKWYRDFVVTRRIVEVMDGLKLEYPAPEAGIMDAVIPD
jgi:polyphosphate kinase 2 (PPK2 family)